MISMCNNLGTTAFNVLSLKLQDEFSYLSYLIERNKIIQKYNANDPGH
jgi:hypothetical protein